MTNDEMPLTTAQVSERIQIEVRAVTRWLRSGRLRGRKSGGCWRIALGDLEAFLESCANRPIGEAVGPSASPCRAQKSHKVDVTAEAEQSEIEVHPFEFQPIEDPNYLKVRTYLRPTDRSVRIGIIEWIGNGACAARHKVLVNRKPMSHVDAMEYAKRFAEKFKVPSIYQREDDKAAGASGLSGAE